MDYKLILLLIPLLVGAYFYGGDTLQNPQEERIENASSEIFREEVTPERFEVRNNSDLFFYDNARGVYASNWTHKGYNYNIGIEYLMSGDEVTEQVKEVEFAISKNLSYKVNNDGDVILNSILLNKTKIEAEKLECNLRQNYNNTNIAYESCRMTDELENGKNLILNGVFIYSSPSRINVIGCIKPEEFSSGAELCL